MKNRQCDLFIVTTAAPSPLSDWQGVSAAAWSIGPTAIGANGLELGKFDVEVSEGSDSNESEAAIMALNAALSEVENAQVTVFISASWICDAINGAVDVWKNDWNGRSHKELWQKYLETRSNRSLRVEGKCVPGADPFAGHTFKFLRKQARAACARRSKELGTPTAGFDSVAEAQKKAPTPRRSRKAKV